MSYIDEFLENNSTLPRDIIRLVKLMREVDEKAYSKILYYDQIISFLWKLKEQILKYN